MLLPKLMRIIKILSSLKMENLKYCECLIEIIEKNLKKRFKQFLLLETANDAILAHPFLKLRWVSKEKKSENIVFNENKKTI